MSDLPTELDTEFPADETEPSPARRREIDTRGRGLRRHATRGILINSGFQVAFAGLGLLRRLVVAAFLTQAEFGLWGIMLSTLITLSWLKQVGIGDKYIQQSEPDQEAAYQKAFTLELAVSVAFFVVVAALLPAYAAAYGQPELIVPGIILAASIPISAFETPVLIAYRNMQFVRQRVLVAVDAVVALVSTIILVLLGFGYWSLVIGTVAGSVAGAVAATITSPYRIRLRYDSGTLAAYASFSWPLIALGVTNMIVVQGSLLIANRVVGLAGVGAIGLAATIASFADRVNGIVNQTLYPAVCTVADRTELLYEVFVKSNRVSLMWAIPFAVGLALFANDLVQFVLGERWEPATDLLVAIGLIVGATQIAFNWTLIMRAVNNTKPLFFASLARLATFAVVMVPALLTLGLTGYIIGLAATVVTQIAVRGYFLGKLFKGFKVVRHSLRAIAPSVPAAGSVLLVRLLMSGERTPVLALGELVLYALLTIGLTLLFERRLVKEMESYLRGAVGPPLRPDGSVQRT